MKEHDNIDDFFRKNLGSIEEFKVDLTPDILVWSRAHDEIKDFYKKKKRRRLIILLFIGLILSAGTLCAVNHHLKTVNLLSPRAEKDAKSSEILLLDNTIAAIDSTQESADEFLSQYKASDSYPPTPAIISETAQKADDPKKKANLRSASVHSQLTLRDTRKKNLVKPEGEKLSVPSERLISNRQSHIDINKNVKADATEVPILALTPLRKLSINTIAYDRNLPIFPMNKNLVIPSKINAKATIQKWQLGLGHSRFLSNPFTKQTEDVGSDRTVKLVDSRYQSLDFAVERRLSKRLSITSGVNYFQQSIDVSFDLRNLVYETDGSIKDVLVVTRDAFTRNVIKNSNDLSINFLANASVADGDLLNFAGNIPYRLDAIQIPFSLKYTRRIGAVSLWTSGGLVGTYLKVSVTDLPVKITKNGVLVSEDINYSPIFDHRILPNISFSVGSEIHLIKNLNLAASLYTFNFNKDLLRGNIGINYGF